MNEVTVARFRCFSEKQTARLAPLTILVGENSTGKSSFLALVRALWDIAFRGQLPDFKEPPYDLGSFDEIAHHRGGRGGRALTFEAGFSADVTDRSRRPRRRSRNAPYRYDFAFRRDGSGVLPGVRRIENGSVSAECRISEEGYVSLAFATANGEWAVTPEYLGAADRFTASQRWDSLRRDLPPFGYFIRMFHLIARSEPHRLKPAKGTEQPPGKQDVDAIRGLDVPASWRLDRPFGSAPVRSRPRRTYDPTQAIPDPEGEYVPMFLATVARKDSGSWQSLKRSIEDFGRSASLFDDIEIKVLGGKTGGPFQVRVRKLGKRSKGPYRNVIDVGYGVSQVLPVVTELLRPRGPRMFLLQQPEVHLHPSAQAALGGLFCAVAGRRQRQIIVETHSDHLIDRIRMDIRDGKTKLTPDDVSILYFQRRNLAVTIHSLGWDEDGNLIAKRGTIPPGYRQFFRTETTRSLGL